MTDTSTSSRSQNVSRYPSPLLSHQHRLQLPSRQTNPTSPLSKATCIFYQDFLLVLFLKCPIRYLDSFSRQAERRTVSRCFHRSIPLPPCIAPLHTFFRLLTSSISWDLQHNEPQRNQNVTNLINYPSSLTTTQPPRNPHSSQPPRNLDPRLMDRLLLQTRLFNPPITFPLQHALLAIRWPPTTLPQHPLLQTSPNRRITALPRL
jgi:hypothetical protein